jgi:uncharacterized membrane-anchored protein YhcB (DUF1043 family)
LEMQEQSSFKIEKQLEKQLNLQSEMKEKLINQEVFQKEVITRLDKQEALVQKISRQFSDLRSILFERTNHLVEKFEEGYNLTSAYINKLMTGRDSSLMFYLDHRKKDHEIKQSELKE